MLSLGCKLLRCWCVCARADRNNDEMLSEEELEKFVDSLTIDQQNLLTKTLMNVTDEQRHRSLTRIFKALDLDHDGRVTANEVILVFVASVCYMLTARACCWLLLCAGPLLAEP